MPCETPDILDLFPTLEPAPEAAAIRAAFHAGGLAAIPPCPDPERFERHLEHPWGWAGYERVTCRALTAFEAWVCDHYWPKVASKTLSDAEVAAIALASRGKSPFR